MTLFLGRQPILDRLQRTYGYELLFRDGTENIFKGIDGDHASLSVIDTTFGQMGLRRITGGKKAFINFTRHLLLEDFGQILPNEHVVIEVLESIEPDAEVVEACKRLKRSGYTLALDDFQYTKKHVSLLPFTDIIKVDLAVSDAEECLYYAKQFLPKNIKLLAERVETVDEFERTKDLGYSYFQGYFFSQPVILETVRPPESKLARIQLLRVINQPDFDLKKAESILKHDPTLTLKLFRYINSAIFGFLKEISSIRHALALLGEKNIRKWATILVLSGIAEDKPAELLRQAIIRARICELLAEPTGMPEKDQELFMVGMFSHLDTMMYQPMESLLADIKLPELVKVTLIGGKSPYQDILSVAKSCETCDWDGIIKLLQQYNIPEELLSEFQQQAFGWADELAPTR